MRFARRVAGTAVLAGCTMLAACASAPRREAPPPDRDRTNDPEFAAAAEQAAANRDFESQSDALAAGVYEPFVHPDSVRPAAAPAPSPSVAPPGADPSTRELLGTLDTPDTYQPGQAGGIWTLQAGVFDSETEAFVRLGQLARDFPDLPRWHTVEGRRFRVYLGRFGDREDAERLRALAQVRGLTDVWVTAAP